MKLTLLVVVGVVGLGHAAHAGPTVTFVGNVEIGSDELRAAIVPPFDATNAVDQDVLERDVLLISMYYWDRGYASIAVGEPQILPGSITIAIAEGPVFAIGPVTITGEPATLVRKHLAMFAVHPGMTFSRTQIADDREALSLFYEDQGYAYVNVLPLTKVDVGTRTIGLTFEIEPGKLSHIERVELDNATTTPDPALRSTLKIAAGDRYSSTRLQASKRALLQRAGREVAVSTRRGTTDALVIVKFEIAD